MRVPRSIVLSFALSVLMLATLMISIRIESIQKDIQLSGRLTARGIDSSTAAEGNTPWTVLDRPMLIMEIPQHASEVMSLAPPSERGLWRVAILWDYIFILGYVLLFVALPFDDPAASIWENVRYCAIATGLADWFENLAMLIVLHDLDRPKSILSTRAFTVLPILGVVKWLLFFLTCRSLAFGFARFKHWRLPSIILRALVTAGAWAALFSLAGLPARPILGFVASATSLLLFVLAIIRLVNDNPPTPIPVERRDRRLSVAVLDRRKDVAGSVQA